MGLDTTHDAFHGAYSAFNRFRQIISDVTGGSLPPHWLKNKDGSLAKGDDGLVVYDRSLDENLIYFGPGVSRKKAPGLYKFLTHSDCVGKISPKMCTKVADELEKLLPKIEALTDPGGGHIAARGGYAGVTRKFIAGCREAARKNEPLVFY